MKKLTIVLLFVVAATTIDAGNKSREVTAYEKESKYNFSTTVEMIKNTAREAGWSIPIEHDMQANLSQNGKEVLPSTILVLCKGSFAYKLLKNDETRKAQVMLPCRIAVYEKSNGKTYIALRNYTKAAEDFEKAAKDVFKDVQAELKEIVAVVTINRSLDY